MNDPKHVEEQKVYMDYNATTPARPEALELMASAFRDGFGNPSSAHFAGRRAKIILDEAREKIAATMGAGVAEIIFTSGGSEGDNLAIKGIAAGRASGHIITTSIEHPAVLETCRALEARGIRVSYLPVGRDGGVDPAMVRAEAREDTFLVSVMWVNNETGVIQPVEAIGKLAREKGIVFHSDGVQAYTKIPVDAGRTPVDMISVSGHKFCAPMGVGALYVRSGIKLDPAVHGGGQEWRMRSGTENIPGIAALGEAGRLACAERENEIIRLGDLRDQLEAGILGRIKDTSVNGAAGTRVANTTNISFKGAYGEDAVLALDEKGIAVSSASACAATHSEPSHVLRAMGLPRSEAEDSLRFSLGRLSAKEDVDRCLEVLPGVIERIRRLRAG